MPVVHYQCKIKCFVFIFRMIALKNNWLNLRKHISTQICLVETQNNACKAASEKTHYFIISLKKCLQTK